MIFQHTFQSVLSCSLSKFKLLKWKEAWGTLFLYSLVFYMLWPHKLSSSGFWENKLPCSFSQWSAIWKNGEENEGGDPTLGDTPHCVCYAASSLTGPSDHCQRRLYRRIQNWSSWSWFQSLLKRSWWEDTRALGDNLYDVCDGFARSFCLREI